MKKIFTLLSITLFLAPHFIKAQQIAFPGAEGAGRFATGGRGTPTVASTVFEVTRLDDPSPTVAGTFRYAVTHNSPAVPHRTVIFRVSGTIRLTSPLSLNRTNTTIAGQTAPGDGICIADYPVSISANNLIIRHMRFRLGDRYQAARQGNDDALSGTGRKNIIIDHCSVGWSNDEALTVYEGDSTTLQWNLISEPLDYSYHDEGSGIQNHGYGGIWGGRRASMHHNLIAHVRGRAPRFDGSRNLPNSSSPVVGTENVDFRNNVIYNWVDYNVNGGEGGNYNVVNNYYKYGPSTLNSSTSGVNRRSMVINPYKQSSPALPYGKFYLEGNYVDNSAAVTANNWLGAAMNGGSLADTNQAKATTPFNIAPVTTQTAQEAYISVLHAVGAILPKRDTLDQRIINDVVTRTGRIIDVQGGFPRGTPFTTSQTAWPTLNSLPAPADTDKDGMPDAWEARRGLNPNSAADRNNYNVNGYTNLENYLNGDSIVAFGVNNTCRNGNFINTNGAGNWVHSNDTSYAAVIATDTMNLIASVLNNTSIGYFNVSYYTTNTIRTYNSVPYLGRNVTMQPVLYSPIVTPVTVRLYISQQEFTALQAADNTITSVSSLRVIRSASNTCIPTLTAADSIITPTATGSFGTYNNGYFVEFQTNAFSTFFIAGPSFTLPLQLVAFTGSYNGTQVSLQWKTQNEINTASFEIEKSTDGITFSAIGSLQAAGNALNRQYTFIDPDFLNTKAFYRLKMIDKDGRFTHSQVINFTPGIRKALAISPNPAKSNVLVMHPKAFTGSTLKVTTVDGKSLLNQLVSTGALQTSLNVSMLSPGMYLLVYENRDGRTIQKFIKQ